MKYDWNFMPRLTSVLLGEVAFFFIYVIIKANLSEKKNKEDQSK